MCSPTRQRARLTARRGVTLPFIVLLIAVFIGMTAFAIDVSRMLVMRAELQTSADAGAMAGAVQLLEDNRAATPDSARAYALRNAVENTTPTVGDTDIVPGHWSSGTFNPTLSYTDLATNAVQVTSRHTGAYFFGPIYNVFSSRLWARGVGSILYVNSTNCVRPLGIPYIRMLQVLFPTGTPSTAYDLTAADITRLSAMDSVSGLIELKVGDASSTIVTGNFYPLREPAVLFWNGQSGDPWTGGNDYSNALSAACSDLAYVIHVGDWMQGESGNKQGPTRQGLAPVCGAKRTAQQYDCPGWPSFIVPIWDSATKSLKTPGGAQISGTEFRVKYVGVFRITGFHGGSIWGFFDSMRGEGSVDTIPSPIHRPTLVR